ncbi:MAG TPA: hypothetical protein PLG04_07465, partial [Anaerolineaceae bacterium]|nr:hypothetical protein [Anaerolineaceae bacterium]
CRRSQKQKELGGIEHASINGTRVDTAPRPQAKPALQPDVAPPPPASFSRAGGKHQTATTAPHFPSLSP